MRMARLALVLGLFSGVSLSANPAHPHDMSVSSLPLAAQSKVWAAVGRDLSAYHMRAVNDGFKAANSNQDLNGSFHEASRGSVHRKHALASDVARLRLRQDTNQGRVCGSKGECQSRGIPARLDDRVVCEWSGWVGARIFPG